MNKNENNKEKALSVKEAKSVDLAENGERELILINISGADRKGLTAALTDILAKYDATILDIGQADIHHTLASVLKSMPNARV